MINTREPSGKPGQAPFAVKVEAAKDLGDTTRSLAKDTTTVAQMVAASLEASRPRLKPRTFHGNERLYAGRVLPKFGSRRISTVTRAEVQAWINELTGEGSPRRPFITATSRSAR